MNIYELQRYINEKKLYQKLLIDRVILLRNRLEPKATTIKDISVEGSPPKQDMADTIHKIVELEKEIDLIDEEIKTCNPYLEELEKILKQYNDRNQLIYYYVKLKGYSSLKSGSMVFPQIGERQVERIVKEIEESLSNVGRCRLSSAIIGKMK